jgi:hypothetical protein
VEKPRRRNGSESDHQKPGFSASHDTLPTKINRYTIVHTVILAHCLTIPIPSVFNVWVCWLLISFTVTPLFIWREPSGFPADWIVTRDPCTVCSEVLREANCRVCCDGWAEDVRNWS